MNFFSSSSSSTSPISSISSLFLSPESKGEDWTGFLHFFNQKRQWVRFKRNEDIIKYFTEQLEADKEIINHAEVRRYDLLHKLLGSIGIRHEYALVKTTNYFWSFEKTTSGIFVQRSKNRDVVRLYDGREPRKGEEREDGRLSDVSFGENIIDLVEFIIDRRELEKKYHLIDSNCKHFSSLLYQAITRQGGLNMTKSKLEKKD